MRMRHWFATSLLLLMAGRAYGQSDCRCAESAELPSCGAEQICCPSVNACDDACGNPCSEQWFMVPQDPCGWNIKGWIDGGFIGNTSSPNSKFNGPYNAVDRSNEPMMNQTYMILEKTLPSTGRGAGGRVDVLYGEDFLLAQSIGLETRTDGSSHWNPEYYGLAIPQAYGSIGNQDLSLQIGHFYSVVGYEGVMSPYNFFYSKAYSYQFAGPFTHWGSQLNWKPGQAWTVNLGLVNGWNALDRVSDDVAFVGKVRYDSQSTGAWTSFALVTGKEFTNVAGLPNITNGYANRTRYSWLVGLPLTCRIDYVFHQWLGFQEEGYVNGERADWYGVDQYLTYKINNSWKAATRIEWFNDEEGTRVGLNRPSNPNDPPLPGNFYSLSFGLNWTPTANFLFRPEIRGDWYDGDATRLPYQDGTKDNQLMLGFDTIFLF